MLPFDRHSLSTIEHNQPMDNSSNGSHLDTSDAPTTAKKKRPSPKPGRCHFFIARKNRYCTALVHQEPRSHQGPPSPAPTADESTTPPMLAPIAVLCPLHRSLALSQQPANTGVLQPVVGAQESTSAQRNDAKGRQCSLYDADKKMVFSLESGLSELIEGQDPNTRIPCPINGNHSVLVSKLRSHVDKCPDRLVNPMFNGHTGYSRGVNSSWPALAKKLHIPLRETPSTESDDQSAPRAVMMAQIDRDGLIHFRDLVQRNLLDEFSSWMEDSLLAEVQRLETEIKLSTNSSTTQPSASDAARWTRDCLQAALLPAESGRASSSPRGKSAIAAPDSCSI